MTPGAAVSTVQVDLDGSWVLEQYMAGAHRGVDIEKDAVFSTGFPRMRRVFQEAGIHATCFVNAADLQDAGKREMVAALVADGHEIASHGFDHQYLHRLSRAEKAVQIRESAERIAEFTGVRPVGFRAAGCAVDGEVPALLEEAGYRYDSSTFPTTLTPLLTLFERCMFGQVARHPRFWPTIGSLHAYRPSRANLYRRGTAGLVEYPITTFPLLRLPLHFSYGANLGWTYLRAGLRLALRRLETVNFVFHLADFADAPSNGAAALPGFGVGVSRRIELARRVLALLRSRSRVATTRELLS